jgi:aminoglycoside phosphotransferase (APT) family kinase protein
MHEGQPDTDVALVRRLLADQFPRWAALPVEPVDSYGTDHALYRVGDSLCARMPLLADVPRQALLEATWLPRLAPHLPLAVPEQVARGRPGHGYPFAWSLYAWLPGASAAHAPYDQERAAVDLAAFVTALRAVETTGAPVAPPGRRGAPLADLDAGVRRSITRLGDRIDAGAALRSWEESLAAPPYRDAPRWLHGDLLPGNLLVTGGRLSAVIDFGTLTTGDTACDLQPAWNVFTGAARERFREEVGPDGPAWLRGRGWALCQAVNALDYYRDTNPGMVRQTTHALRQILGETAVR